MQLFNAFIKQHGLEIYRRQGLILLLVAFAVSLAVGWFFQLSALTQHDHNFVIGFNAAWLNLTVLMLSIVIAINEQAFIQHWLTLYYLRKPSVRWLYSLRLLIYFMLSVSISLAGALIVWLKGDDFFHTLWQFLMPITLMLVLILWFSYALRHTAQVIVATGLTYVLLNSADNLQQLIHNLWSQDAGLLSMIISAGLKLLPRLTIDDINSGLRWLCAAAAIVLLGLRSLKKTIQ